MASSRPFLTAQWRQLAMLNYRIDPEVVRPYVPPGTELDTWHGETYVSVVGFLFLDARLLGVPVPWHRKFSEVNLRMYVRRPHAEGDRRGVVFIREVVPRRAVATVARWAYGENFVKRPMRHTVCRERDPMVDYQWQEADQWNRLSLQLDGPAVPQEVGSHEEFIVEHYWGYTARHGKASLEYRVEHPPWQICHAAKSELDCDVATIYGPEFVSALSEPPESAFVADGSAVKVYRGVAI
jgi:hypothetical protein